MTYISPIVLGQLDSDGLNLTIKVKDIIDLADIDVMTSLIDIQTPAKYDASNLSRCM